MSIVKCRECFKEVSTGAKVCPHCGISNPGKRPGDTLKGLLIISVIVVAIVYACSPSDAEKKAKAAAEQQRDSNIKSAEAEKKAVADSKDAACKQDLQCWGDKGVIGAGVYCKDEVERLAKFSVRWTDGFMEPKFSRFRWLDKAAGTMTFRGDKIEFQNGFGAYQRSIYECDFNPTTNTVLAVRAEAGHL